MRRRIVRAASRAAFRNMGASGVGVLAAQGDEGSFLYYTVQCTILYSTLLCSTLYTLLFSTRYGKRYYTILYYTWVVFKVPYPHTVVTSPISISKLVGDSKQSGPSAKIRREPADRFQNKNRNIGVDILRDTETETEIVVAAEK